MNGLVVGLKGEARIIVTPEQTAQAFGSGLVPVFATPALVALVETAAVQALEGRLAPGETSVGTRIELRHLAATPVGGSVLATAELTAIDGRMLTFSVRAADERETVGEGTHQRVVVNEARFLERVQAKLRTP